MTSPNWPTGLPPRPVREGFSEELGSGTDRSSIATGEPQYRNRSNATPDKIECVLMLEDSDQVEILDEFFRVSTSSGCLRFDWKDALGSTAECRFVTAPKYSLGEAAYRAEFTFEVMK
jgi:hypothetical protein